MPSPVSPSRLMFKRARTREPWQRRGESRPRRSPPRRPPCSPAAQRSPAGAAPTPPPVAPRSRGPAVRGSPAPSKMVVLEAATAAAHGIRHPPPSRALTAPDPRSLPRPAPGHFPGRAPLALGRAESSRQPPSSPAGEPARRHGARERESWKGSLRENTEGTPHSPPFCFPPFSCHPKPPTAKTTALAPPGRLRSRRGGGCPGRRPSLPNVSPTSDGGGGGSGDSGG